MLRIIFLSIVILRLFGKMDGKPNIILLVADDLGWNDLSFHGSPQIPTPNLDTLAKNGVILNNYYVCPLCSPSRGSLMTGLYPIHTGMQHYVIRSSEPWGLPLNKTILPNHLKELGYMTHAVGKWHLGFFRKEYTPTFRGFDSHYGYWTDKEDYFDHTSQMGQADSLMWGLDFRHNMEPVNDQLGNYSTNLFAEHAAKVIKHHNTTKPLFLYVAYQAVHSANFYERLQAPENYINRFSSIEDKSRRIFAGMVSAMDDSVKIIVDALQSQNILNNSIIVFTSDNGGAAAGFNDNAASNWPLRGVKSTLWEGGVRGISFIWSPLLRKVKRISMELMHITDWLPTLYHAAGGNVSHLGILDGYNLWPTLSLAEPSPRSEVLLNIDPINNFSALRVKNFKILTGAIHDGNWDGWYGPSGRDNTTIKESNGSSSNSEIRCGPKPANASTSCQPKNSTCLFDVEKDPCEYYNLAQYKPQILDAMLKRLEEYRKSAVPPRNKPADPRSDPKFHNYQWINWMDYE